MSVQIGIIVVYMLILLAVGGWIARRQSNLRDYFLGGRNIPAWAVMLAVVATETSSVTFVGTPSMAYSGSMVFLQLVLGFFVARIIIALYFLPAFFQEEIYTIYAHLGKRFGTEVQRAAGLFFFVTRALAAGVRHYCAALVLFTVTDWSMGISILVMGLISLVYTVLGGLSAVIWTEVFQMAVMIVGAVAAFIHLLGLIPGGWDRLVDVAGEAGKLHIFDFGSPFKLSYTFWSGLIGGMFLSLASHGADQDLVQRLLSCKSLRGAKLAIVGSGILVFVQFTLFLVIGVMLFVFYSNQPPDLAKTDQIFPYFVKTEFNPFLGGVVIAAIFAAAMSSTASALNSLSATTMSDFLRPLSGEVTDERRDLRLSRWVTVGWCIVLMAVAYGARGSTNILETGLKVATFTYGSLLGAFLLAIFTPVRAQRAITLGMCAGSLVVLGAYGMFREFIFWPWYIPMAVLVTCCVTWIWILFNRQPQSDSKVPG
ncbi:MAG: sodium:solute symporter [bacterium]